jgi:hypothetical protein
MMLKDDAKAQRSTAQHVYVLVHACTRVLDVHFYLIEGRSYRSVFSVSHII